MCDLMRRRGKTWIDSRIESLLIIIMLNLCAGTIISISVLLLNLSLSFSRLFPLFCLNTSNLIITCHAVYKHTYPNQFFFIANFFFGRIKMPSCTYIKIPIIKIYRFAWVKLTIQQLRKRINNFVFFFLLLHGFVCFSLFKCCILPLLCCCNNSIINEV